MRWRKKLAGEALHRLRSVRRAASHSRLLACAGVLLAALMPTATVGVARSAPVGASRAEPGFAAIPGWHLVRLGSVTGRIGRSVSAANIPFSRADLGSSAPVKTAAALPRAGILIWAQFQ